MKTPSLESLACAKRANVATWRQLAAVVALVTSLSACEKNPSGPAEAGQVSFNVRFLTAPLALSTIVATLSLLSVSRILQLATIWRVSWPVRIGGLINLPPRGRASRAALRG